jgi:hypothetical protein
MAPVDMTDQTVSTRALGVDEDVFKAKLAVFTRQTHEDSKPARTAGKT